MEHQNVQTDSSAMQNSAADLAVRMSAHDCAQGFLHGGARLASVSAGIRANYNAEFIGAVARELIRQSGALTSGDKAIANFGTTVKRAVPRDENDAPIVAPLTVKFKLRKSRLSARKTLEAEVAVAKPARKPDAQEKAAKALWDAAAHLCDCGLREAAMELMPAMAALFDVMATCDARTTLAATIAELERMTCESDDADEENVAA